MTPAEAREQIHAHIKRVGEFLQMFFEGLSWRAVAHDESKLNEGRLRGRQSRQFPPTHQDEDGEIICGDCGLPVMDGCGHYHGELVCEDCGEWTYPFFYDLPEDGCQWCGGFRLADDGGNGSAGLEGATYFSLVHASIGQGVQGGMQRLAGECGGVWKPVVFASDLPLCEDCKEEVWCEKHGLHYWECACIGPTEDDVEYREIDGVLHGRRLADGNGSAARLSNTMPRGLI